MTNKVTALPSNRQHKRVRLQEMIQERSLSIGVKRRLASGGQSKVFFDMKMTLLDPEGLQLAADIVLDLLKDEKVDAIGGLVIGACPIANAVSIKSFGTRNIRAFYVRKEKKETGTQKLIEGPLKDGDHVVLVDDVTTEGGSALLAVDTIKREINCTITKVITVVDREQGAKENLSKHGIELVPIFTMSDFDLGPELD